MLSSDVSMERQFVVGSLTPSASEFIRADVAPKGTHGDGVLTAGDTIQVRRYVAGLDPVEQTAGTVETLSTAARETQKTELALNSILTTRTISLVQADTAPPGKIIVYVQASLQGDEAAAGFTLGFDPAMLRNPVVTAGPDSFAGTVVTVNKQKSGLGQLAVLVDNADRLPSGRVVSITFDVVSGKGIRNSTPLIFTAGITEPVTANMAGDLLATRFIDAMVTIPGYIAPVTRSGR
jgi:hypothetical protein